MSSRKPNLFIIGSMKSGSTTLHNYLDLHPQIFMSKEKEPGYFAEKIRGNRTLEEYLDLFQESSGQRYLGESSTHYTKLPTLQGVPQNIHVFNPDARLIYIMRNPFERTISHYWHAVRDIHLGRERHDIISAIKSNPEYTAFSDYAMQLQAYLEVFPKESIYTLTLESLLSTPTRELNKILHWLELPAMELPETIEAHNKKPESMQRVAGLGLLNTIRYSRWWEPVSRLIPKNIRQRATKMAYKETEGSLNTDTTQEVKELLQTQFDYSGKIANLSRLLDRSFPEWEQQ